MNPSFHSLSQGFLLSSGLLAAGITAAYAHDEFDNEQVAIIKADPASVQGDSISTIKAKKALELATILSQFKQTPREKKLEFALVLFAANKGIADAQFRLANYYIDGELVETNESEAEYWLEQAIAQGHQGAEFIFNNLGSVYFDIGC